MSLKDLTQQDVEYLQSRGCLDDLLERSEISSHSAGTHNIAGLNVTQASKFIALVCRSMSGTVSGIHTFTYPEKNYQYHQVKSHPFLPIMYGEEGDLNLMYETGEVIISEGYFDKVAMGRIVEGKASIARLSKGISGQLAVVLKRYVTRVWLAFDNDIPGEEGRELARKRLGEKVEILDLRFPDHDPAKLLERKGLVGSRKVILSQIEALGF